MVQLGKLTKEEAHKKLKGTFSKDKNEILYGQFNINYNNVDEIFKRGTIIFRKYSEKKAKNEKIIPENEKIIPENEMIINESQSITSLFDNYFNLTDKLLLQDDKFSEYLKIFNEKSIFLSHEDIIKEDFWKNKNLDIY